MSSCDSVADPPVNEEMNPLLEERKEEEEDSGVNNVEEMSRDDDGDDENAETANSTSDDLPKKRTRKPVQRDIIEIPAVKKRVVKRGKATATKANGKGKGSTGSSSKASGGKSGGKAKSESNTEEPVKLSAAKKKKLAELEKNEEEIRKELEKFNRENGRLQARLTRLMETQVKFPVKDELIATVDPNKSVLPLPTPFTTLSDVTSIPNSLMTAAITVWDMFNLFQKPLGLNLSNGKMSWSDFVECIRYSDGATVSFLDMFCVLLRVILNDVKSVTTIRNSLLKAPPSALVERAGVMLTQDTLKSTSTSEDSSLSSETDEMTFEELLAPENFDAHFNGSRLLPRNLNTHHVDLLRVQVVLRVVLLRLEPVEQLRKAVLDVVTALHTIAPSAGSKSINNLKTPADIEFMRSQLSELSSNISEEKLSSLQQDSAISALFNLAELKQGYLNFTPENLDIVSGLKSKHRKMNPASHMRQCNVNKDAIFGITADFLTTLSSIYMVARSLETTELFALTVAEKVTLLTVLCEASMCTKRVCDLLESNADYRSTQIAAFNKSVREAKARVREGNEQYKERAIELCRARNMSEAKASAAEKEKKGSKKKGSGQLRGRGVGKDGMDPTQEQLQNAIDELIVLETFSISKTIEDIPLDPISDDEDDNENQDEENDASNKKKGSDEEDSDDEGLSAQSAIVSRRQAAVRKSQQADREKAREIRREKNAILSNAYSRIEYALGTNSERDLRAAIKVATSAGFKTTNQRNGQVSVTTSLYRIYRALWELDQKKKEDKALLAHEKTLQEYFVRTSPLGTDRSGKREYWYFQGDERFLFVKDIVEVTEDTPMDIDEEEDKKISLEGPSLFRMTSERLYSSRSRRHNVVWKMYCGGTELYRLWEALDERGERENALKAAISARFELVEPVGPAPELSGHPWIGLPVTRVFGKKNVSGRVVGWLPPQDKEPAIWHILHSDGDEEDLEASEVIKSLDEEVTEVSSSVKTDADNSEKEVETADEKAVTAEVTVSVPRSRKAAEDSCRMLRATYGIARINTSTRGLPSLFGIEGLRQELLRFFNAIIEPMKRAGRQLSREDRRLFELSIRNAVGVNELSALLVQLETILHDVQTVPDKDETEVYAQMKAAEQAEMESEGWLFSVPDSAVSTQGDLELNTTEKWAEDELAAFNLLGKTVRRMLTRRTFHDGVVTAVLPAIKNVAEGVVLLRISLRDGDREDIDITDAQEAYEKYLSATVKGGESDGEGSDSDEESDEEDSTTDSHDIEVDEVTDKTRLWATLQIRQSWLLTVEKSRTISELACALAILEARAAGMDLLLKAYIDQSAPVTLFTPIEPVVKGSSKPKPVGSSRKSNVNVERESAPRNAKKRALEEMQAAAEIDSDDEAPRVSKRRAAVAAANRMQISDRDYYDSGRPSRAAANRVGSYAE